MTEFFVLEPYVAGGIAGDTVVHLLETPPRAERVGYEFQDWNGDWIVTSHPVFLATSAAAELLVARGCTGFTVRDVQVSTDDIFPELNPGLVLPKFVWLDVVGRAGEADLGLTDRGNLVVSEVTLELLRPGLSEADITPWGEA
jgi:hypothetical protein